VVTGSYKEVPERRDEGSTDVAGGEEEGGESEAGGEEDTEVVSEEGSGGLSAFLMWPRSPMVSKRAQFSLGAMCWLDSTTHRAVSKFPMTPPLS
jgi:hypothetical protein